VTATERGTFASSARRMSFRHEQWPSSTESPRGRGDPRDHVTTASTPFRRAGVAAALSECCDLNMVHRVDGGRHLLGIE
jgi:hypothetical protein